MAEFRNMMSHLPEHVSEEEIEEMFSFADKNKDGKISWEEFLVTFAFPINYYNDNLPEGDDHSCENARIWR